MILKKINFLQEMKLEEFTGDEAGRVTVWSLKTGSPICKLFKNYF